MKSINLETWVVHQNLEEWQAAFTLLTVLLAVQRRFTLALVEEENNAFEHFLFCVCSLVSFKFVVLLPSSVLAHSGELPMSLNTTLAVTSFYHLDLSGSPGGLHLVGKQSYLIHI